jgi:hypothetical protein
MATPVLGLATMLDVGDHLAGTGHIPRWGLLDRGCAKYHVVCCVTVTAAPQHATFHDTMRHDYMLWQTRISRGSRLQTMADRVDGRVPGNWQLQS